MIPWKPGGAQGTPRDVLKDGDVFLAAGKGYGVWVFPTLRVINYISNVFILADDSGERGHIWENVIWYCTIKDLVERFPVEEKLPLTADRNDVESVQ